MKIPILLGISFCFNLLSNLAAADLPSNYQELSAAKKKELLISEINRSDYGTDLPDVDIDAFLTSIRSALHGDTFRSGLKKTFSNAEDIMPADKSKFIHALGTVLGLEYRAARPSADLGVLGEASVPVIGRLSLAAPEQTGFTPGAAFKFLLSGSAGIPRPSVNIVVMKSLEGQAEDAFFFRHAFSNDLPPIEKPMLKVHLTGFFESLLDPDKEVDLSEISIEAKGDLGKYLFLKHFEAKFASVHPTPRHLPIAHLLSTRSDGAKIFGAPKNFYKLVFSPGEDAKRVYLGSKKSDYRLKLSEIPVGSKLYDVYGYFRETPDSNGVLLGGLYITHKARASSFGDEELFFQHHR